jgi:hypothetical protein
VVATEETVALDRGALSRIRFGDRRVSRPSSARRSDLSSTAVPCKDKLVSIGAAALVMLSPAWGASSGEGESEAAPLYGIRIPAGYRDWTLISVASVGAPVNDTRAKLGNG